MIYKLRKEILVKKKYTVEKYWDVQKHPTDEGILTNYPRYWWGHTHLQTNYPTL